ncbi:hypothetical protein ASPZODRAFT_128915 [Penicilliopsis zonata CBS 506.65]|uniref:Uncharacterized protein n=1 Tax=Penicilliopsis zonata CBS 506.65 TaxID=1073090 RepID=A0A1L9SSW3_9EURO|nr:hypothetical protein ASPZODRAFT_128915 [Penicilliopsis zonata CBS 506.65]OJJ50298.1 hypothetical protein ASPZODRAFT_128915 [Penicilliopsis zonata CBS 506.65]
MSFDTPNLTHEKARSTSTSSPSSTMTLGWHETSAADAVARFVRFLGLPSRLADVG